VTDPAETSQDLRLQYDRLRRSVTLFRDLVGLTDSSAIFTALLDGISKEFPINAAVVGRVRALRGVVELVARRSVGGTAAPTKMTMNHPIVSKLLRSTRGTLLVTDPEQLGARGMLTSGGQSLMAVRFRLEGDEPDLLILESDQPAAFTADDVHFVQDLLQTLEATLLSSFARSRADQELDMLIEVTRGELDMASDLDEAELARLLSKVLEIALSLTGCRHGAVLLANEENGDLQIEAETFSEDLGKAIPQGVVRREDGGPSGIIFRVVEDNRSYLANDTQKDINYYPLFKPTRASLAVPISFQERCIGVIVVEAQETGRFSPDHQRRLEKLASTATSFVRRAQLYQETRGGRGTGVLIKGRGPAWTEVERRVERASATTATVCLRGESGTGKELMARAVHHNSDRSRGNLIPINCAAIPENLLESELFGHARGAFTGAVKAKRGLFHEASGGTLFLDEMGEMPMGLQAKLLRALESGEVRRVGETKPEEVDVRVVAATSRDLEQRVREGQFREDLFYRLCVVRLHIPPLRSRTEDIPLLVEHFLGRFSGRFGKDTPTVPTEVMEVLLAYAWPGNVRELQNCIERAVLLSEGEALEFSSLPPAVQAGGGGGRLAGDEGDLSVKRRVASLEADLIRRALEQTGGNRTHACKLLEISHRALLYKMKDFGIDIPAGKA